MGVSSLSKCCYPANSRPLSRKPNAISHYSTESPNWYGNIWKNVWLAIAENNNNDINLEKTNNYFSNIYQ